MLKSMVIALPTICTDCPIGGARAIIRDHYNGILTPVGNREALTQAMTEIIENSKIAAELSDNAVKLREELDVNRIVDKWMNLL